MRKVLSNVSEISTTEIKIKKRGKAVSEQQHQENNPDKLLGKYVAKLASEARKGYGLKYGDPEITQREYAKQLGVAAGTVQAWESAVNMPSFIQAVLLAWDSGKSADEVGADLIKIKFPYLAHRIPSGVGERMLSISEVLEALTELPNDQLMALQRKILEELNNRFNNLSWSNPNITDNEE